MTYLSSTSLNIRFSRSGVVLASCTLTASGPESRPQLAGGTDPDGVGKLNPRLVDLADVLGCCDRFPGERNDGVVELGAAILEVSAPGAA
jgi:hypothetical protein